MLSSGFRRTVILISAMLSVAVATQANPRLEGVSLEVRAMLATGASAFPPPGGRAIDVDDVAFKPDAAAGFLTTNQVGRHYGASKSEGGFRIGYAILQHSDQGIATTKMQEWKQASGQTVATGWDMQPETFRRGVGLAGVAMPGAGQVARGQRGPWIFEVTASSTGTSNIGGNDKAEIAVLRKNMELLLNNARRYQLFPYRLQIEYSVGTDPLRTLAPGAPFRVPLQSVEKTSVVFTIQVLDSDSAQVREVRYRVELSGGMAQYGSLVEDGGARTTSLEVAGNGEPIELTWVFPEATSAELSEVIDKGRDVDLSLSVEARFPGGR